MIKGQLFTGRFEIGTENIIEGRFDRGTIWWAGMIEGWYDRGLV
jgi:hypothetical protein